ncbi:hypothetical protein L1887_51068 [Cichorium endivia]|nr:hypothetical protein L1887_51068 [Cichorium endivia]
MDDEGMKEESNRYVSRAGRALSEQAGVRVLASASWLFCFALMHLLVARLSIALILLQSTLQHIERRGYDSAVPACRAVGKADLADCLLTVCSRRAGRCCLGAKGPIRLSGCKSLGTMPRGMPSQHIPGLPPVGVGPKPSEVWLVLLFVARARHNKIKCKKYNSCVQIANSTRCASSPGCRICANFAEPPSVLQFERAQILTASSGSA